MSKTDFSDLYGQQGRAIHSNTKVWFSTELEHEVYLHKIKMIQHKNLVCLET